MSKQTRRDFVGSAAVGLGYWAGAVPAPGAAPLQADSNQAAGQIRIVPRPRFIQVKDTSRVDLRPDLPVFLGKTLFAAEHRWATRPLLRKLQEQPIPEPSVVTDAGAALPSPCILIGAPEDHSSLRRLNERLRPKLGLAPKSRLGEAHLVSCGTEGVRIAADTASGAFYGIQSVLQALGANRALPALELADAPAAPFRALHFGMADPQDIPTLQRLIREVLPRHKTNTVIAEIRYHFQFRSHPEINEKTMFNDSQVRDLSRLCRDHSVRLIPLLNCFGHQSWGTERIDGLLRAYPQFNETPCKPKVITYSWCGSDPRIAPIVCELIDELIDAFETEAIHLGMDEVLELALCPFCRSKSPAELFAKVVNEFHRHVVGKRKVRMLIWGDRLIDGLKTPYNPMNGSRNGTHPALHMVPKDILLCDWHYHLHESYPSVEMFADAGFDFVACGWRNKDAIKAFISYARKHGKDRYRGYVATNWGQYTAVARYLLDGLAEGANAAEIQNVADCYRLGMDLAWGGA